MTPLEVKMAALLVDCEGIMEPFIVTAQKWEIISDSHKQTKTVIDQNASITISYGKSSEAILNLKSYKAANSAFERDKVFSKSRRGAGYWGSFNGVLTTLLADTCKISTKKILFNHAEALTSLRSLRAVLSKKYVKYIASANLIGATITSKNMSLPDEIELTRLTIKERNDRQPLMQAYNPNGLQNMGLTEDLLELRLLITVPVDHSQKLAFFNAQNDAVKTARKMFVTILDSVLVVLGGKAILGSIRLHGGIVHLPVGQPFTQEIPPHLNITIRKKDLKNISIAYDLISGGSKGDKTLSRALHRFLLGRKRNDLVDKLVDYVISWEALLLTQEGSSIAQELSYRFSLNGASLLLAADNKSDRFENNKKLKVAYSVRSVVVHGGGEAELNKTLKKGDFNNLKSLCDYLERNFRCSIIWLASIDVKDRPYRKHNGWEELIWLD